MSSLMRPRYTAEQYLALERVADHKSEFVNGQIFAMAGASREHNLIAGNVFAELRAQFRGRPCEAYISDMRIQVSSTGIYTYPDVAAVCDEPLFDDAHGDTLLNATLIVEVLSPSTEAYDRGEKFAHYRRLETLTDYVLITQDKIRVEHFVRQGQQWVLTEVSDREGQVHLVSIDCDLALREIYERVEFPANEVKELLV